MGRACAVDGILSAESSRCLVALAVFKTAVRSRKRLEIGSIPILSVRLAVCPPSRDVAGCQGDASGRTWINLRCRFFQRLVGGLRIDGSTGAGQHFGNAG